MQLRSLKALGLPNRIGGHGPSQFALYDHTKSGREALGFFSPLVGAIRRQMRQPLPSESELTSRLVEDLTRDGLAIFSIADLQGGKGLLSELLTESEKELVDNRETIEKWREQLNNVALAEEYENGEEVKDYRYTYLNEPSITAPNWRLALNPEILAVVNSYMGAYSRIQSMSFQINTFKRDAPPQNSQLCHRDGDGTVIKLFVYLSDVSRGSGPFCYVMGSHRGANRTKHGPAKRTTDEQMREIFGEEVHIKEVTGGRGTAFLANTSGYHRGGYVSEGTRHIFRTGYFLPWIDRSDYGLAFPSAGIEQLHPAQRAAISR